MGLLTNIFGKKESAINSYEDFWVWFQENEKNFFNVVKQQKNIEKDFFNKLSPKLNQLKEGFFYLTGMFDSNTAELVITPDGMVKNIVFVEELVSAAPQIEGWRFTALKPALDIKDTSIQMAGYKFDESNLNFYSNEFSAYPDEIDITIIHDDFNEEKRSTITNGVYIFLDNYLGELEFATIIDNLTVEGKDGAQKELVPINKLKDFLNWRQKEFIEKYEDTRRNTEDDSYSILEAKLENGIPLVGAINTSLLKWESKASHPWILNVEIKYNGKNNNGLPDDITYQLLNEIENSVLEELKDFEGFLNIGRQTADGAREIYLACKDFRKPSKVLQKIQVANSNKIEISYNIYKDKYWQSFNRFDSSL